MTFTNELPTSAGNFLWKSKQGSEPELVQVTSDGKAWFTGLEIKFLVKHMRGQWCRLVPAEEIQEAFLESRAAAFRSLKGSTEKAWNNSRAKRVMEGKE